MERGGKSKIACSSYCVYPVGTWNSFIIDTGCVLCFDQQLGWDAGKKGAFLEGERWLRGLGVVYYNLNIEIS